MAKWKPMDKNCEDCGELMVQVAPQKRFCPECARKRKKVSTKASRLKDWVVQMITNPHAKYCFGCAYWRSEYGSKYCNYIFDEDHRRPCLPGKDCTVRKTEKKGRKQ